MTLIQPTQTTEINNAVENMVVEVKKEKQLSFSPSQNLPRMNSGTSFQSRPKNLLPLSWQTRSFG